MSQQDWDPSPGQEPRRVAPSTSIRVVRPTSLGSALGIAFVIVALAAATSLRQPAPTTAPLGAAGLQPPSPTAAPASSAPSASEPTPTPIVAPPESDAATSGPSPDGTPWRTSPPSTCNPYVKPCDPTVPPTYDYVGVVLTSDHVGDIYGNGKVIVTAGGHTYTCTPTMSRNDCFWDIPPGVQVVARQYPAAGSYCQRFYVIWADYTFIEPGDCSPISFTTKTMEAQIVAQFGPNIRLTPPPATEPPPTDPPATATPTEPPTAPPDPTSSPS